MSGYNGLLSLLRQQKEELKLEHFLEVKGYSDPQCDDFGLNQWTCKLIMGHTSSQEKSQDLEISQPAHLVSFLSVPIDWQEESIDTNSEDLRNWLIEYKWLDISGSRSQSPFSQKRIQACTEGLIQFQLLETSMEGGLEEFLLIRRDGVCEFGIGKNGYLLYEKDTIFHFIEIVGRFWQFLTFLKDFHEMYFNNKNTGIKIILNLRGTKNSLLGNLAEGWNEPITSSLNSYRPKCNEKHLQIKRNILPNCSDYDVRDIVRWCATRIDNAWGQFEPRCYVSKELDEATPFAFRKKN